MNRFGILTILICGLAIHSSTALATDDHGNDCATATAITTGGVSTAAIIDPVDDEDWLSFNADAGHRYDATTFIASTSFYYTVQVIGPDCVTVIADWSYASPNELSVVTPTTDTYFIRIASISSAFVGYMEIGLTDQGIVADDAGGQRADATPIPADGTIIAGATDYVGDIDWFTFAAADQHLYRLEVRAIATTYNWYSAGELYRDSGYLTGTGWSGASAGGPDGDWISARYYVPAGNGGNLLVRISGWPGLTGPYELRVTDVAGPVGDDHGDNCAAATAVITDGTVTEIFVDPETDEDWLSLSVQAGNRYELTTLIPSAVFNPVTDLIADDCATVLDEWGPYLQSELSFIASSTGTYYLRTTSAGMSYPGYLALGITDRGPQTDDYSGYEANATSVPTDGTVTSGAIDYDGDNDYLAFTALAGHSYSIQYRALDNPTDFVVASELFEGAGLLAYSGWSYGGPAGSGDWIGMAYAVPAGPDRIYSILMYGSAGNSGGPYELTITDLGLTPPDDYGDDFTTATPLATDGTPAIGVIGLGGDHDWFSFTAEAQRVYSVEVRALVSPDTGGAGGQLFAPDGVSYLGFTGWSFSYPPMNGDWSRTLYYVPAGAAGDYFVDIFAYYTLSTNYEVRVLLGPGLPGDFDNDGIPDGSDNCPTVYNPDQADNDLDGVGDCCDPDSPDADGDGIADECDNCPAIYNPTQLDANANGIGDVCEYLPGDMNCDSVIDVNDATEFVLALLGDPTFSGCDINLADVNTDGSIDGDDIQPFINLIIAPDAAPDLQCDDATHCQLADQAGHGASGSFAQASDRAANGGNGFWVAEDFHVTVAGDISQLCWTGIYHNLVTGTDCSAGASDDFQVVYYDADGPNGQPGTLRAGPFLQSAGTLTLDSRNVTGNDLLSHVEYQYHASHYPVAAAADECLWVEITNLGTGNCFWYWGAAPAGNGNATQDQDSVPGPQYAAAVTLDFDLSVCVGPAPLEISPASCTPPPPPNDDCANAQPIGNGTFPFSTVHATTDGPLELGACNFSGDAQVGQDIWYCYTASCTGHVTVNLCGSVFDTKVAIYHTNAACSCPAGPSSFACNDDFCGLQSQVTFASVAGTKYLIRVGGFAGATGTGTMTISCGP